MEGNTVKSAASKPDEKKSAKNSKAKETRFTKLKGSLGGFFAGVKTEFRKIIWPTQKDTLKSSAAVIVVATILGVFIAMLDTAIKFGLGFIL